jgi:hypothetical protein
MKFDKPCKQKIIEDISVVIRATANIYVGKSLVNSLFIDSFPILDRYGYEMIAHYWYPSHFVNMTENIQYSIDFIRNFKSEMRRLGLFNILSYCGKQTDNLILQTMCFRE